MKLFIRRYLLPLILLVSGYLICLIWLNITYHKPENIFDYFNSSTLFVLLTHILILRITDDWCDYKNDLQKNQVIFNRMTLTLLLFTTIYLSILLGYDYLYLNIAIIGCIVLGSFLFNHLSCLTCLKTFHLPLCLSFVVISHGAHKNFWSWLIVILGFTISVIFYSNKVKQQKPVDKSADISKLGGKGYHLKYLQINNTPPFITITTDQIIYLLGDYFFEVNKLFRKQQFAKIEKLITDISFNQTFFFELLKPLKRRKLYAVRSSAIGEDTKDYSYAGILESVLNSSFSDLEQSIKDCLIGAYTKRVYEYLKINQLDIANHQMAIVIQEMISADFSGVINTINPITNNPDQIVISATTGLGDKLVSGIINSSDYYLNSYHISCQGPDILSKKILKNIKVMVNEVISKTTTFQDIEFVVKRRKVYFLQARTITPYQHINTKHAKIVLDNANIIESYCGAVTPLTYSFATTVYEAVYRQVLKCGKVSQKIIDSLDDSLKNLLCYHDSKIYYNMNSWYHLNSIFPGRKGISAMEGMMGVKTKLTNSKKIKMSFIAIVKMLVVLIKRLRSIDRDSRLFADKFDQVVTPYLGISLNGYSNEQLLNLYDQLSDEILADFSTPIVNDIGSMLYYATLRKFIKKCKVDDNDGYISFLVGRQGDIISAQSAPLFFDILTVIKNDNAIKKDFLTLDPNALHLKYHDHDSLVTTIKTYLKVFGSRVMDELKLETITLYEDPSILYAMLQNYLINDYTYTVHPNEQRFDVHIPFLKKPTFNFLVKKTRYFIKNREHLRLKRTYIYSVVRSIFRQIGANFIEAKLIDKIDDLFFLTIDEIFNYIRNHQKLAFKKLIQTRRTIYQNDETKTTFSRLVIYPTGTLTVYTADETVSTNALKGIPSGAGVVDGYAKYVKNHYDAYLTKDDILLAYRTDPGWVTLFPMCKGMVIEKGSILSHSAVVAREMGIPAVVGVSGATQKIKTGDHLIVDAIKGEVQIK